MASLRVVTLYAIWNSFFTPSDYTDYSWNLIAFLAIITAAPDFEATFSAIFKAVALTASAGLISEEWGTNSLTHP